MVTYQEKVLYHQIHPIKLATDWIIGGLIAYILLWRHLFWLGIIVAIIPSVVVTIIILKFVDLQKYKKSALGHYIKPNIPSSMQEIRLLGALLAGIGAWYHL